jgi:hypothetical protein
MRFERDFPGHAEPVSASELEEGGLYFSVTYADDDLLIPLVQTMVFVGRDLEQGDSGQVYFQDVQSYRRGVRYETATEEDYGEFFTGAENEVKHIFMYDKMLNEIVKCSLRRRGGNA